MIYNLKNTKNLYLLILMVLIAGIALMPFFAGAQLPQPTGGQAFGEIPSKGTGRTQVITLPNPLQAKTFQELIQRIVNWLLVIGAPILVLMIIIGAFQIMTGAGNPEKITMGRRTITYAVFGYALLLISNGIILIIKQLLGVQ